MVDPITFTESTAPEPLHAGGLLSLDSGCSLGDPNCQTCFLDGMEHGCSFVRSLIRMGVAEQCPDNDCGPQPLWGEHGETGGWKVYIGSGWWVSNGEDSDTVFFDDIQYGTAMDAYALSFVNPQKKKKPKRPSRRRRDTKPNLVVPLTVEGIWYSPVAGFQPQDPCDISDIPIPENVFLSVNIADAENHHFMRRTQRLLYPLPSSLKDYENANWFYDRVRNANGRTLDVAMGNSWDYKQLGSEYQALGNFNFGMTGAAIGFGERFLLREAGRAQIAAKTSRPEWGTPGSRLDPNGGTGSFGDDPNDQKLIRRGYAYYVEGCYKKK